MFAMKLLFLLQMLFSLPHDLFTSQAVGDRFQFLAVIRRLRELLGNIDPSQFSDGVLKLVAWLQSNPTVLGWLKTLLGSMMISGAPASAHAMAFNTLSDEDFEAAGIADNPGAWITLVQALIALARLLWGKEATGFAATVVATSALEAGELPPAA
jgi:hypothetical protein